MKIFVYKTLFVFVCLFLLFQLTVGMKLKQVNHELEKLKSIKFYNVSHPLLMLPFISRASEIMSKKILVQYDNTSFLLNFDKSIFSKNIDKQAQSLTNVISIEFIENKNSFSEQDWRELYKLSEETFVDESDSSKAKAAGAGLTDND